MNGFYIQNKLEKLMDRMERNYLRPCQVNAFECSAACGRETHFNRQEVEICLRSCSRPYEETTHLMEKRIFELQDSLQSCANRCNKDIDRNDLDKIKECREGCVGTFIKELPNFEKNLQSELQDSHSYLQCVMKSHGRN